MSCQNCESLKVELGVIKVRLESCLNGNVHLLDDYQRTSKEQSLQYKEMRDFLRARLDKATKVLEAAEKMAVHLGLDASSSPECTGFFEALREFRGGSK